MDLEAVKAFLRIAHIGNLTRAAEALGTTQPSLTRLVRKLEAQTGASLLVRTPRGVVLSDAGRAFADRVAPLLDAFNDALREARTGSAEPTGRIAVGLPQSMKATVATPLVDWFVDRFPAATLALQLGVSHEIEQALGFGQIDLGLLISPQTQTPLMTVEPLATEQLCLFEARREGVTSGDAAAWASLADLPLALPPAPNQLRRRVETAAAGAGIVLRILAETGDVDILMHLVERGLAGTLLPRSLGLGALVRGSVQARPIGEEKVVWTLARSTLAARTRLSHEVGEWLFAHAERQAQAGMWRAVRDAAGTRSRRA